MVPPRKGLDDESTPPLQDDGLAALAAAVGHQINNPLTYVLTNVALLQDMLSKTAPSAWTAETIGELRDRIGEIGEGAQRIARVVRDLRVFVQREGATSDAVDLTSVCEAALGMASNRLQQVARVRSELRDVPPVAGDEGKLGRTVYHLLLDAARAIEEGDAERNEIVLRTGVEEQAAFVEVSGTGSGGTSFRLTLPLRPITRAARRPSQPSTPEIPRLRILVVDDEPVVSKSLTRMLGEEHDVVAVTSGRAALDRLARESFDVVMTDLMMPDVSGMDLYRTIGERHPALVDRVLFLTGGAFTDRAARFVRDVGDRCLHKPFSMGRVRAALLDLLKRNAH